MKFIFASFFVLLFGSVASAATLKATAIDSRVTDFEITFSDSNNNGLLDIEEVTFFSGVEITNLLGQTRILTVLLAPARIDGITSGGMDKWLFFGESFGQYDHNPNAWGYAVLDQSLATVPLPAGFILLITGLAMLRSRQICVLSLTLQDDLSSHC